MRILALGDRTLTLDNDRGLLEFGPNGLRVLLRTLPGGLSHALTSYGWEGGFAVDAGGETAWISMKGNRAARVELDSGHVEMLDGALEDIVLLDDHSLLGAGRGEDETLRLFAVSSTSPTERSELPVPEGTPVYFDNGGPYPPEPSGHECFTVRLTKTASGVAAVTALGELWIRWADGHVASWRIPAIFEGSSVAHAYDGGVVVSSNPHGNDVSITWFDRRGIWVGRYSDDYKSSSPCIPCGDKFFVIVDDELLRFEGRPLTLTGRATVGWKASDATVTADGGGRIGLEDSILEIDPSGERAQRRLADGSVDPVEIRRVGSTPQDRPWHYTEVDDPDLGPLWLPDPDRTARLVRSVSGLDWREAQELLQRETGGVAGYRLLQEDSEAAVYGLLRRNYVPRLDRDGVERILGRLQDGTQLDPFVTAQLRWALPEPWARARVSGDVAEWVDQQLPTLCEGTAGERRVIAARIGADVSRWPTWFFEATLDDGTTTTVDIFEFDTEGLARDIDLTSGDDGWPGQAAGVERGTGQRVHLQIGRVFGTFVFGVQVQAKGGGKRLRTASVWEPVALADTADVRRLFYAGSATDLFIGRSTQGWAVAPTPEGLSDVRPCTAPSPHPAVGQLVHRLVEAELLELNADIAEADLWRLEVKLATADTEAKATSAFEDALLDLDAVEELYADTDQLRPLVAEARTAFSPAVDG